MKDYLAKILEPLSDKLKAEIYIFDARDECIYPADPENPPAIKRAAFTGDVGIGDGYTFFRFSAGGDRFSGAVAGTKDAERIAYMMAALLEKRVTSKDMTREEKLRAIILGDTDLPLVYEMKRKLGKIKYNVFAISFHKKDEAAIHEFLRQLATEEDAVVSLDERTVCFLKKQDDTDDYHSASEFATLLNESIAQELGKQIMIGIGGTAASVSEIGKVYGQAVSAFRLGKLSDVTSNIYSYKELVMLKMIEDIPRETLKSYLGILADKSTLEILSDEEMMNTAKEFLSNSLNISETARLMYMHRNTLIYRLDKIEKATGLNIRNFSDAVTFRMIITLYRLLHRAE